MQTVTDSGADLAPEQTGGIEFHTVPLSITLAGVTTPAASICSR
jgi:fatty acid-binding protein DegV